MVSKNEILVKSWRNIGFLIFSDNEGLTIRMGFVYTHWYGTRYSSRKITSNIIQPIPPQSPVPQKRQTPLLLIILILVLVSIASYFGYQNWQLKQQISQIQPTPQPKANQPLAGTPEDPTTNWKTINISADPSFGLMEYQIKIPATWEQISHSSNFLTNLSRL